MQTRIRQGLIVFQVALSVVLLAGAGLLVRSLINLETFDAGFDRDKVLTVKMTGYSASRTRDQVTAIYGEILERLRQIPGVHSVSYSNFTPMSGKEVGINIAVEGYTPRPGETANERFVGVSPGYFETMGIPLLAGRDFNQSDVQVRSGSYQATTVAIINRTMAHRFFGDINPVGKHFRFVEGKRPPLEIVGVVAASKYNDLREPAVDFFYIPGTHGDIEIRSNVPAKMLAIPLEKVIHSLDGTARIGSIKTLRETIDESLHSDRLIAVLCTIFSMLALTLTCIGLYAALAFDVQRRTSEIGIRMALGAWRGDILQMVVGQGIRLALSGLALGIPAAVATGSLFASLLFGVRRTDPLTFAAISLILLTASTLACYLPARRALHVSPIVALRCD